MKLIIAIVSNDDANKVQKALVKDRFSQQDLLQQVVS